MSNYPFCYTVVFHDNYDAETKINSFIRESGMGFADSFTNAMKQIEGRYGDDLISIKNLELFEENDLIILPERIAQEYSQNPDFGSGKSCDIYGNLQKEEVE